MKAIGIPQPGAWLIINHYHSKVPLPKRTAYRGDIFVYALSEAITPMIYEGFLEGCRQLNIESNLRIEDFERGGFIGTARLTECESTENGEFFAVLEDQSELGFKASNGKVGVFTIDEDPFPISSCLKLDYSMELPPIEPSPTYSPPRQAPPRRTPTYYHDDDADENSAFDHVMHGVDQQLQRQLNKAGRDLTKGAFEIGSDLLGSWLGGGKKPRR